jgi:hypothetical protein
MIDRTNTDEYLAETFSRLERAALANMRCPENGTPYISVRPIHELVKRGDIRVEISGKNYRQVFILRGPNAGACTLPNPLGHRVWRSFPPPRTGLKERVEYSDDNEYMGWPLSEL